MVDDALARGYAAALAAWRWVDWQAMSALAVAAVACLALIPILRDWRRGKRMAKVVRARMHAELVAVRPVVQEVFDRIPSSGGFNVPAHRASIEALQALLAHAQFLRAKETAKIVDLVTTLGVAAKVYPLNAGEAFPDLLHELDDAIDRLSR